MSRYFSFFLMFLIVCPCGFAIECPNDKKLIPIKENQIGHSMYTNTVYTNKLKKCETYDADCDLYTGGEWKLKNTTSNDFNVVGNALCLDSEDFDKDANKAGPYCYCKIQELDNYTVISDWVSVKHYQNVLFDESKNYSSEYIKQSEKMRVKDRNTQECMVDCSRVCTSNLSRLIKVVRGYYVCGDALYKMKNVICTINKQLVKAKAILVFDDVAEIQTKNDSIVFTRDENGTYVGTYDYLPVYLKTKGDKIYVGTNNDPDEECL